MYGMIWTKPEIAYHTNVLARYMTKPGPKLLKAAKKLLLYLKYTRLLGIRFSRDDPKGHGINTLSCYVDSSDGDDRITRRSTGGYALFFNSSPAAFRSMLQRLATLSSCESELVQLSTAVQEIKHVRELLELLGFAQEAVKVFEDNQAAIRIAESPGSSRSKTKHVGRRFAFISESIEAKEIVMMYVPTDDNIADIFTKPLAHDKFVKLRRLLLNYTEDMIEAGR